MLPLAIVHSFTRTFSNRHRCIVSNRAPPAGWFVGCCRGSNFSIKLDTSPDTCNLNSETTTATPNDLHVKLHAISNIRACYSRRRIQRLRRGAMGCGFFYVLNTIVSYDSP